ncbi:MAG: hypothetical protein IT445_19730 [Phycisphaeraceae bacterium]|nr:hypothetical protein [Phycisphaeraceae bacterium]
MPTDRNCERRTLNLVMPGVVVLCLCAAAMGQGERTVSAESLEIRTLAGLVTRIAEAARQVRPNAAVIAETHRARQAEPTLADLPRPAIVHIDLSSPLREALLNLPPPDRA